jgi:hypothetical protein
MRTEDCSAQPCSRIWDMRTGIRVPVIVVNYGAFLCAGELLVNDFFELDHFGGSLYIYAIGVVGEVGET